MSQVTTNTNLLKKVIGGLENLDDEIIKSIIFTSSGNLYIVKEKEIDYKENALFFLAEYTYTGKTKVVEVLNCIAHFPEEYKYLIPTGRYGEVKYIPKHSVARNSFEDKLVRESVIKKYISRGKVGKLYFKYSAMNGGKSTALLQIAHNYTVENGQRILVAKPSLDTKGDKYIVSRLGNKISRKCDFLIDGEKSVLEKVLIQASKFREYSDIIQAILIDEAQFLKREDVEELLYISNVLGIPVICFGLRTDFRGEIFEGSKWLLGYAQDIEELSTRPMSSMGDKDKKATMNIRLIDGKPSFEGSQVVIDNDKKIGYKSVSCRDFLRCREKTIGLEDFGRNCNGILLDGLFKN